MTHRLGLGVIVAVLAAAAVAIAVWFLVSRDDASHPGASESVELVLANPQELYGKRVSVQGSVSGSFTANTFTLGEPQPGPEDLLVVRYGKPVNVEQNEVVSVVGTLREFRLEEIGSKLHLSENDAQLLDAFAGKPVLVADDIETAR